MRRGWKPNQDFLIALCRSVSTEKLNSALISECTSIKDYLTPVIDWSEMVGLFEMIGIPIDILNLKSSISEYSKTFSTTKEQGDVNDEDLVKISAILKVIENLLPR